MSQYSGFSKVDNCVHHCPTCTCPIKKRYAVERGHVTWEHMADYDEVGHAMDYFAKCVTLVYERTASDARYRVVDAHRNVIVIESTGVTEHTR